MKNDDLINTSYTIADSHALLEESRSLIERARRVLEEPEHEPIKQAQKDRKVRQTMSTELTPQMAGELYTSGQSVIEVARAHGMTYAQVRKLLTTNGTTIRSSSDRLKGRTRKSSEG
jgi:hypothetical protein